MSEESKKQPSTVPQQSTTPTPQPGGRKAHEPEQQPEQPQTESPPGRREGVVSNPDPESRR